MLHGHATPAQRAVMRLVDAVAFAVLFCGIHGGWLGIVDVVVLIELSKHDYLGAMGVAILGCTAGWFVPGSEDVCTQMWGDAILTCKCTEGVPNGLGKLTSSLGESEGLFEDGKRKGIHVMKFIDGGYAQANFDAGVRNGTGMYISEDGRLRFDFSYTNNHRDEKWYMVHGERTFTLEFELGRIISGTVVEQDGARYDALTSCRILTPRRALKSLQDGFKKAYGSVVVQSLKKYDPLRRCKNQRREVEEMLDSLAILTEW